KYSGIEFKKTRHAFDLPSHSHRTVFRVLEHGLGG
ncbi:MAG: hypothetical protein ACI9TZ_003265, partial [Yoonia sp.]